MKRYKERMTLFHRRALIRSKVSKTMQVQAPAPLIKTENRSDDPNGVTAHKDRYYSGKALIILGGPSGKAWQELREEIKPDVLLGANGVNQMVYGLDYWICAENMKWTSGRAGKRDIRAIDFMEMFHRNAGAKTKLISHHSWGLLRDKKNCISIRRQGYERGQVPADFSLREYGEGFMNGWIFDDKNAISVTTRVGTVAAQLLHMAGILGCSEVHTIGLDLLQRNRLTHHWYKYPIYQADRFRKPGMFVDYKGVKTQLIWIETAEFFKSMEVYFRIDGLKWVDHSDGLLKIEGLECAL